MAHDPFTLAEIAALVRHVDVAVAALGASVYRGEYANMASAMSKLQAMAEAADGGSDGKANAGINGKGNSYTPRDKPQPI